MIISSDAEKAFHKIQHSFKIKVHNGLVIQRTSRSTVKININGEKFNTFPLKSGTGKGFSLSPYRFHMVFEVLGRPLRQLKGIYIGKVKVFLFAKEFLYKRP